MGWRQVRTARCLVVVIFFLGLLVPRVFATIATTTVNVSICGDAIVNFGEVCDDGALNNDGAYASSTALKRCNPSCSGYGPYCGDAILQAFYAEECDDGNNTDGDNCSAQCLQETPPVIIGGSPPSSGGGGGSGPGVPGGNIIAINPTKVIISGKAYPNADVNILKDGAVIGVVRANGAADFLFETSNVTPGATTFGFWAQDADGMRSIAFTTTFQVTENAVTTVSGVFLPPTIDLSDRAVRPGDIISFFGSTVPHVSVETRVNSEEEHVVFASSTDSGKWRIDFDTSVLEPEAFHTARALFDLGEGEGGAGVRSGFSHSVNFYVGNKDIAEAMTADLNVDGKVNLIDFSILLFHWGTDGGDSNPPADINLDGNVGLTDFSILLFHWTG